MTILSYTRPVSALIAGYIADKISPSKCTKFLFFLLLIAYAFLVALGESNLITFILITNLIITMVGVFALRGIFYSLLKDSGIPISITGAAVGIVSFIGYMPDIYIGPLSGFMLDDSNIERGFKIFYIFFFLISSLGLLSTIYLKKT